MTDTPNIRDEALATAMGLYAEAATAERDGDSSTAATKNTAGDAKLAEATTAIRAL